jgi:hypothetical protein
MRLCELIARLQQINDENHESDDWLVSLYPEVELQFGMTEFVHCRPARVTADFPSQRVVIYLDE